MTSSRKPSQPSRFMVAATWPRSDQWDVLLDEGGDAAITGVILMLAALKQRDRSGAVTPGTFTSERALADALGEYVRFVPLYRSVGILVGLRTPLWDWQTSYDPVGGPKRTADWRSRRTSDATGDVTSDGLNGEP